MRVVSLTLRTRKFFGSTISRYWIHQMLFVPFLDASFKCVDVGPGMANTFACQWHEHSVMWRTPVLPCPLRLTHLDEFGVSRQPALGLGTIATDSSPCNNITNDKSFPYTQPHKKRLSCQHPRAWTRRSLPRRWCRPHARRLDSGPGSQRFPAANLHDKSMGHCQWRCLSRAHSPLF